MTLLDDHGCGSSMLGRLHGGRAPAVPVRDEFNEAVVQQVGDGGMHGLAGQAHAPGDLGHRRGDWGERAGPEHLETSRGQPDIGAEVIAGRLQAAMQAERREENLGEQVAPRGR
jgi:hypothetical protein